MFPQKCDETNNNEGFKEAIMMMQNLYYGGVIFCTFFTYGSKVQYSTTKFYSNNNR